jgi:hypothetical protein
MTAEFKEFKKKHPVKSLGDILADQERGIITEDYFGDYVNQVEARVS